jgi:hypothetical protein
MVFKKNIQLLKILYFIFICFLWAMLGLLDADPVTQLDPYSKRNRIRTRSTAKYDTVTLLTVATNCNIAYYSYHYWN